MAVAASDVPIMPQTTRSRDDAVGAQMSFYAPGSLTREIVMGVASWRWKFTCVLLLIVLCLHAIPALAQWQTAGNMNAARFGATVTALPTGKVLIFGGAAPMDSAELFDPAIGTYTPKTSIRSARRFATATLLRNGKVLIAGGSNGGAAQASAELYDPIADTFTDTGPLNVARGSATATLLLDGRVLIAGGSNSSGALPSAELYDPASGTFALTGALQTARVGATATLLPNGRVLVASGHLLSGISTASAEIYDPASGNFAAAPDLVAARELATATLLSNGRVLFVGGFSTTLAGSNVLASAELYDPVNGSTVVGSLTTGRYAATATLLPNSSVLVAGGWINSSGTATATAETFTQFGVNRFFTAGSMSTARSNAAAVLMPGGSVLLVGGQNGGAIAGVERYDYTHGVFNPTGDTTVPHSYASATLLPDGQVLIAGANNTGIRTVDRFDPASATFHAAGLLPIARSEHTATLLADGHVLFTGGIFTSAPAGSQVDLYDPVTQTFSTVGPLSSGRVLHSATLLPNGKVLVAGGTPPAQFPAAVTTAELYDPATRTFSMTGSLGAARYSAQVVLLQTGKVLFAGGLSNNQFVTTAELYDPSSGTFAPTGNPVLARESATTTLLRNGKVLIAGGYAVPFNITTSAELYDPGTGTFTATGSMLTARTRGAATLLPDGRVLISGGLGSDGSTEISNAEIYDPARGTFSATGALISRREGATSVLLRDGRVLVAGGRINLNTDLASAEIFDAGLGLNNAQRPTLASVKLSEPALPLSVQFAGSGLRGSTQAPAGALVGSEGSAGGSGNAATNFPLLQLQRVDNEQQFFVPAAPSLSAWTDSALTTSTLTGLPQGLYRATVFVNAVPSVSRLLTLGPPAVIAVVQGSPQAAVVTTPFGFLLQVTVSDASGNPIRDATVNFTVPASGASATLSAASATTDANGSAAVSASANTHAGSYLVFATVAGTNVSASFSLSNVAATPAHFAATGGDQQSAQVATAFVQPLAVTVSDTFGNQTNAMIDFTTPATGASAGLSSNSIGTGTSGVGSVAATANTHAGSYLVTAVVRGHPELQIGFALTNTPAAAAQLSAQNGPTFDGTAGLALTTLPIAVATDAFGNPVSGVAVDFATSGADSGVIGGTHVLTDANGLAALGEWTLSPNAGSNTVQATSAGLSGSPLGFTATGTQSVDVRVALTTNRYFVQFNHTLDYVIVVSAAGPSNANNVRVTDHLSPLLDVVRAHWVCVPAVGSSCAAGGNGELVDQPANIAKGSSVTFVLSANVSGDPAGITDLVSDTASIAVDGDTDAGNDSATISNQAVIFRDGLEGGGS